MQIPYELLIPFFIIFPGLLIAEVLSLSLFGSIQNNEDLSFKLVKTVISLILIGNAFYILRNITLISDTKFFSSVIFFSYCGIIMTLSIGIFMIIYFWAVHVIEKIPDKFRSTSLIAFTIVPCVLTIGMNRSLIARFYQELSWWIFPSLVIAIIISIAFLFATLAITEKH